MSEKKNSYRGSSEALRKAIKKYQTEKVDTITVHVPKGKKDIIRAHAADRGESMNQFVTRAIDETMERDKQ